MIKLWIKPSKWVNDQTMDWTQQKGQQSTKPSNTAKLQTLDEIRPSQKAHYKIQRIQKGMGKQAPCPCWAVPGTGAPRHCGAPSGSSPAWTRSGCGRAPPQAGGRRTQGSGRTRWGPAPPPGAAGRLSLRCLRPCHCCRPGCAGLLLRQLVCPGCSVWGLQNPGTVDTAISHSVRTTSQYGAPKPRYCGHSSQS